MLAHWYTCFWNGVHFSSLECGSNSAICMLLFQFRLTECALILLVIFNQINFKFETAFLHSQMDYVKWARKTMHARTQMIWTDFHGVFQLTHTTAKPKHSLFANENEIEIPKKSIDSFAILWRTNYTWTFQCHDRIHALQISITETFIFT